MHEVFVGVRAGNSQRLLIATAALLLGTLGLAWTQSRLARALGPEQQVGQLPIWVRLPAGWQRDADDPQAFVLPIHKEGGLTPFSDRHLDIQFQKAAHFESPEELAERLRLLSREITPAMIGRFPAFECIQRLDPLRSRLRLPRERLTRVTSFPNGYRLVLNYDALLNLTPADLEQFDDICRSLRLAEPAVTEPLESWSERAALRLPELPGTWSAGPDLSETPAVFVGGLDRGVPVWAVGAFRTFLTGGRQLADLLADYAAAKWLVWDIDAQVQRETGADGREIAWFLAPPQRLGSGTAGVGAVRLAADAAAIILVYADGDQRAAAFYAARKIAAELELAAHPLFADLPAGGEAGQLLAGRLKQRGGLPRWGRAPRETRYRMTTSFETEEIIVMRSPVQSAPERGYEGSVLRREIRAGRLWPAPMFSLRWQLDGQATAYSFLLKQTYQFTEQEILEARPARSDRVERTLRIDRESVGPFQYTIGPAFVALPAESLIQGWVARGEPARAVVECTSLFGPATHQVLLQRLEPEGDRPRLLLLHDFMPFGEVLTFDDAAAETLVERAPGMRTERID